MFDNKFTKRDALAESVKKVMLENEIRRHVEFTLNEQLGIHSKNALPHEHHAQYDAMLKEAIHNALSEGQWPKKNMVREEENPPYMGTGTGSGIFAPRKRDYHIVNPQTGKTVMVTNNREDAERTAAVRPGIQHAHLRRQASHQFRDPGATGQSSCACSCKLGWLFSAYAAAGFRSGSKSAINHSVPPGSTRAYRGYHLW